MTRLAVLVAAGSVALLAACRDPAAPPRVRSVTIDPLPGTLVLGASVQLRATVDADPGADTTVRWTTVASPAGQITAGGVLSTCYPGGGVTVIARSVVDSTKRDSVRVGITSIDPGWAFPSGIARAGAATPPGPADFVDPTSVNGEIEVEVTVKASTLARSCRAVQRIELRLSGAQRDTTFSSTIYSAPFTDDRTLRGRLRTTAVPNGDYVITGGAYLTGLSTPEPIVPLRVTIRN